MSSNVSSKESQSLQVVVVQTSSQPGDRLRMALELILRASVKAEEQVGTKAVNKGRR